LDVTNRRQEILTLICCFLVSVVDGFDVLVIAFTGSSIASDWNLAPDKLGILFGSGLAGMTIGSILVAPFVGQFSRKSLMLTCVAIMTLGMAASALSGAFAELVATRFFTGLGVGIVIPTVNTVASEAASAARRNLFISIVFVGYPLGSSLASVVSIPLLSIFGWHSVFWLGAILGLATFLMIWRFLPTPQSQEQSGERSSAVKLLGRMRTLTLLLSATYLLIMMNVYFVLNWTPRLVEMSGLTAAAGSRAGLAITTGSLAGGLLFGLFADRIGLFRVSATYLLGFAVCSAALSLMPMSVSAVYALSLATGFGMAGSMASLYAWSPRLFPQDLRIAGTGVAVGLGRLGGTSGPIIAGYGLAWGLDFAELYRLFAGLPAVAIVLLAISRSGGRDLPLPASSNFPQKE
jgi:predicted MFS family arabinose efflux permease